MISVEVSLPNRKKTPSLKFPALCVNCGKPKKVVMPLKVNMGMQVRDRVMVMDLPVPLCGECEHRERQLVNVTLLPFSLGGFFFFILGFIPAWLFSPEGTTIQTIEFPLWIGLLGGIVAGLAGGTLVEFITKLALAPAYGRLLLQRPLTVLSLFDDSEDVLGVSVRFSKNREKIILTFENEAIGRDFQHSNLLEKP